MPSVHYQSTLEGIEAAHLMGGFFENWPNPPDAATHLRLLQGSYRAWLARDGETGPVVGFINATSDGVLSAFIPLLEVLPEWRKQGIGAELVRRMLHSLEHLYSIDLVCDPQLEGYYARLGMRPLHAMTHRNYARQSGT